LLQDDEKVKTMLTEIIYAEGFIRNEFMVEKGL
jgi:hypothetical protein